MLDHVGIPVSDFERSKSCYEQALAPLGYALIIEPGQEVAGCGQLNKPDFWIFHRGEPGKAVHVAFAAEERATVDLRLRPVLVWRPKVGELRQEVVVWPHLVLRHPPVRQDGD